MCYSNGKVQLPALQQYPEPLHSLFTHQHPESEHFLSAIGKYNQCFQIASFRAKGVNEGNFTPTFKVYHRMGRLMPDLHSFRYILLVMMTTRETSVVVTLQVSSQNWQVNSRSCCTNTTSTSRLLMTPFLRVIKTSKSSSMPIRSLWVCKEAVLMLLPLTRWLW